LIIDRRWEQGTRNTGRDERSKKYTPKHQFSTGKNNGQKGQAGTQQVLRHSVLRNTASGQDKRNVGRNGKKEKKNAERGWAEVYGWNTKRTTDKENGHQQDKYTKETNGA